MTLRAPSSLIDTEAGWGSLQYSLGSGIDVQPGRGVMFNVTAAAVASIKLPDGSVIGDIQLPQAGTYIFNLAVTQVAVVSGTFTAYRIN